MKAAANSFFVFAHIFLCCYGNKNKTILALLLFVMQLDCEREVNQNENGYN